MRKKARRRGFTLMELVVCLIIGVVLMAALTAILQHKRDYVRQNDSLLLWSGQARATFNTMSRDVREADDVEIGRGVMELAPPGDGGAPIVYRLEDAPSGAHQGRLLVREQDGQRSVLATEVAHLTFERRPGRIDIVLEFSAHYGSFDSVAVHETSVALVRGGGGA